MDIIIIIILIVGIIICAKLGLDSIDNMVIDNKNKKEDKTKWI